MHNVATAGSKGGARILQHPGELRVEGVHVFFLGGDFEFGLRFSEG